MVTNTTTGKPRGYAFVEFEHERDMHCKYLYIFPYLSFINLQYHTGILLNSL